MPIALIQDWHQQACSVSLSLVFGIDAQELKVPVIGRSVFYSHIIQEPAAFQQVSRQSDSKVNRSPEKTNAKDAGEH